MPKTLELAAARETLFYFVRHGAHEYDFLRNMTDGGVEAWFKVNGFPWDETIAEISADFFRPIPEFENLVSETNYAVEATSGISGTATMRVDGVEVQTIAIEPSSTVALRLEYLSQWISACNSRDKAIGTGDIDEVLTMATKAFSSVDAFLLMRAKVFNARNPTAQQLTDPDSKGRFVTTQDKIKKWLPVMANGLKIDLSKSPVWTATLRLKKLRDDVAVHAKVGISLSSADQVANAVNDFREMAKLMFTLEAAFGRVDRNIIRAMLHPIVSA